MQEVLERYGFGRFAVLMVAAGLNNFQLKRKAEVAYWPKIREILESNGVPDSPSHSTIPRPTRSVLMS